MNLNFSLEFYVYLICSALCFIIFIILLYTAFKNKKEVLFLLSFSIFCFMLNFIVNSSAVLLMDKFLFILGAYALFGSVFFILFFIDYTLQEHFTAKKLTSISVIGTLLIIASFQVDAVTAFYDYGFPSLKRNGYFSILFLLMLLIFVISIMYWVIKTIMNTPNHLKKNSRYLLYAAVMYLIGIIFLFLQQIIIVPFSIIFNIIGMIIIIIAVIKEPKILYILPFKTYRLIVIFKKSDVEIFSYKWESSDISDDLLGGLMSAINKMGLEVINQGELQYIAYEKGIFLIKRTKHLVFGLIVNKTSKFLNKCLSEFSIEFQNKYESVLKNWNGDLGVFKDVNTLLEKHFGYIPSRIPQ